MDAEEEKAPAPPAPRLTRGGVLVVLMTLLTAGNLMLVVTFFREGERNPPVLLRGTATSPAETVEAFFVVSSVDANSGSLSGRLEFRPDAQLVGPDHDTLTRDLRLYVNTLRGEELRVFKAGQVPTPVEVTLPLTGGLVRRYPFDRHSTVLEVEFEVDGRELATSVLFQAPVDGYRVVVSQRGGARPGVAADLEVRRSHSVIVVCLFLHSVILTVAVSILILATAVVLFGKPLEATVLGFIGGALFAIPAVRGLLPAAPPMGSLMDFVVVFWCQGVVAVSLVAMMVTYVRRR
ncbi:MAG: DUF4436 family protein [Candidatus Eremiobacterota bacterium]